MENLVLFAVAFEENGLIMFAQTLAVTSFIKVANILL